MTVIVSAHRWRKNGDHPQDGDGGEGKVVRYYRHPDYPGDQINPHSGKPMHDHGWIDQGENGLIVCPGDWVITIEENGEFRFVVLNDEAFSALYWKLGLVHGGGA